MAYSQGGLIAASDFNGFVGGNPTTTANTLNATWATGGGQAGYGQTAVANVTSGSSITTTPWNQLFYNTGNAASHQGTSITSISNVSSSNTITFNSSLQTNLNSIYAARGNAASQGSTSANTITTGSAWTVSAVWTHTVTFANGDAARYFFNSGGQIKMTCTSPAGTAGTIQSAFANLATATGTVVISGQSSGARTIAGTSYNGITKVGGSGSTETLSTNSGYFGLTTANTVIFDQNTTESPYSPGAEIRYIAKTNGAQGSNSDNGTVVTIYTVFQDTAANGSVASGSTVTCTAVPPASTYIANTWGAVTIAGSVVTS
jgi:hypothetical protein